MFNQKRKEMKTRKSNIAERIVQQGGCCSTTPSSKISNDPCCEQPVDGSSCCDKTASKEVNAIKTGCC